MITAYELGVAGRLGNQLFQYAALLGLGLHNKYEVKIPNLKNRSWHGQECLLNEFNITAQTLSNEDIPYIRNQYKERDHLYIDKNYFNIPDNTNISGHFQSTFYFSRFEQEIIKQLTPKQVYVQEGKEIIEKLRRDYLGYEIISLHLRRGDNTDVSNTHENCENLRRGYGINGTLSKGSFYEVYLQAAKAIFSSRKVKFLIFTGGSRDNNNIPDIEWCKENLVGEEYIYPQKDSSTMIDFCKIMACDHNILGHNSSFGWWAAFIGKANKTVVAPYRYHAENKEFTHREKFYPESWILV